MRGRQFLTRGRAVLEIVEVSSLSETSRNLGQCQAAVARATSIFGRIDVLFCCSSEGAGSLRKAPNQASMLTLR